MAFDKGSLILVDYTATVKDTKEVFDTTVEADAKEHSIHDENMMYRPKLVSVGELSYPVLRGLDESLAETNVGDKLTIEVAPEKAFGERDSKKIRMIPIRKLGDDAEKISVGDSIEIDNKKGIIRYIGSGRVQIDYNHKHAGKTILFDVNVIKSLDTPSDKVDNILQNRLPVADQKISFDLDDKTANIRIPREILRADGLQIMKHFIQSDIFKFVPSLKEVNFIETHVNKQAPQKEPDAGQTPDTQKETPDANNDTDDNDDTYDDDDDTYDDDDDDDDEDANNDTSKQQSA